MESAQAHGEGQPDRGIRRRRSANPTSAAKALALTMLLARSTKAPLASARRACPPVRRAATATPASAFVGRCVPHASSSSALAMEEGWGSGGIDGVRPATRPPPPDPWENPRSLVGSLLERTATRAISTLSTNSNAASNQAAGGCDGVSSENEDHKETTVRNILDATYVRSSSILEGGASNVEDVRNEKEAGGGAAHPTDDAAPRRKNRDKRTYLGNPGVTPTALAHSLWRSAVLPRRDTVIDATCGNGKDCLALAAMLFPEEDGGLAPEEGGPAPQLIGIDVQSRAIGNTRRSLLSSLPPETFYDHVALLERSHEHLMDVPADVRSVGLVCYNLGYLPGAPSEDRTGGYKELKTQTETTLSSITDASLLLRKGGLLSVMTYPGSSMEESVVVERFAEGLAMLTTRDPGGWRGYLESIPDRDGDGGRVRMLVTRALERVAEEGREGQTWRAFVHRPLGRPLSPVLVTATRIK